MALEFKASCPICNNAVSFETPDDFWSARASLQPKSCPVGPCATRERALADVLSSLRTRAEVARAAIHEAAPAPRGLSLWLRRHCGNYLASGYFPDKPFGEPVRDLRNEDLEKQTFADRVFDIVLHLDVLEHLFRPFEALREIERTLKPGGLCLFAASTYAERMCSEQVAFLEKGELRIVGEPEYHGNPQDKNGSLVTWRYGYDLPLLISRETGFDVEVRRWQSRDRAIMGPMTEIYILRKARP